MSTVVTAEELLTISDTKDCRHELVAGELRKKELNGWRHGIVANNVALILGSHIFENRLGLMLAGGTGFLLRKEPDTVLAPDFAFIANANKAKGTIGHYYWPGAPDLAVEVLSPGDTSDEVAEKVSEWLGCGCAAVWVVDPKLKAVTIYQSPTKAQVVTAGQTLSGDPVLPGFNCLVDELFQ